MTTEELIKAIDILAGQGNQVDCGGQLKDILKACFGAYDITELAGTNSGAIENAQFLIKDGTLYKNNPAILPLIAGFTPSGLESCYAIVAAFGDFSVEVNGGVIGSTISSLDAILVGVDDADNHYFVPFSI